MKITKITQQKRSSRVNIFIDGKFAFGISKKILADFNLYKGKILGKKEINKIIEKDQQIKALEKSFRWLGIRPRSKKELEEKLKEKEFDQRIIKKTLKRLKELNYLDDKKFAESWLEAKKLSGRGKYSIMKELKRKGIAEEIIKKTLEKYSKKDEIEIARQLIRKKMKLLKKESQSSNGVFLQKQKIARFLANRGFSWEVIKDLLKND